MMRGRSVPGVSWVVSGALALVGASGCAVALVGAGAVAGYAISRDHVEVLVEHPYNQVWAACVEETKRVVVLKETDQDTGRIEGTTQGTHVVVTLQPISDTTIKIIVKARKHMLPNTDVAQRLAIRIARRLG